MSQVISVTRPHVLSVLAAEIEAAVPALQPTSALVGGLGTIKVAQWSLSGDGTTVRAEIPDAVNAASVTAVINAHDAVTAQASLPLPLVGVTGSFQIGARVRTTDATVTEIYRVTLAPLTLYRAKLELLGIDAGNGVARYIEATVIAKRLGGGALLVSTPAVVVDKQDAGAAAVTSGVASWAISASVSGNDFLVTVAGTSARQIDWFLAGPAVSFAPSGS